MTKLLKSLTVSSVLVSVSWAQNDVTTSTLPEMTEPLCRMDGDRLTCSNIMSMMEDMNGHPVLISSSVSCASSPSMFDFRQAEGCTCTAQVTTGTETKTCGCTVCPAGYGINPLSVDCGDQEDPYVMDTCTSLDCNFDCNGKCSGSCDVDPLPTECASLCSRDGHISESDEFIETQSDIPSEIPSDVPSDVPSGLLSDIPSDVPTITPTLSPTLTPNILAQTTPSAPSSSPVALDVISGSFSLHRMVTFALSTATVMFFTL
ncbi:hypothetical protein FisN_12Hh212 [Fistulifera solaris]|uniref:TNFR-Cys domain-containing protein n=1 Tax=Fistulifera solaris TaxID=1519565 RepID=A0A1Z5KBK7_FISSO|nr:hypothetical protein FisN_12Hh212 [Fistulifera solaris]|eukprot:GAX23639.1 hypothetical protein FisN_12Hh212 [Fistulifera solaris]